ncbi:MAG: RRXRR domain-containing protein [Nostoc sp.]|uniref:RRXRR domain-containing protein n=1 Tax=Nostoc sp. TaxID=1180 RepID=UPI002FF497C7
MRIPVVNSQHKPLMPTKPSRARKWIRDGKAILQFNDLGQFYVQLIDEPRGAETQPIVIGIDPGKLYSGVGVQSAKITLFTAHLVLPFQKVKDRMEQRHMMRRGRRGRRINRKVVFSKRAHRQKRFDNRRGSKLPPSIRANRQLELRVVSELCKILPITGIVYELVEAKGSRSFSPVMVGQKWMLTQLVAFAPVKTCKGWETSNLRNQLGLQKQKHRKGDPIPATHAVDGVALACSEFIQYEPFHTTKSDGHQWTGSVSVTTSLFIVIRRPPISRRQLHLMVPAKGGIRRKYGGTITRHGLRKGDLANSPKGVGYVSGDTEKQISVSDANWKRLGQITASKVQLIRRSNGLIVA